MEGYGGLLIQGNFHTTPIAIRPRTKIATSQKNEPKRNISLCTLSAFAFALQILPPYQQVVAHVMVRND